MIREKLRHRGAPSATRFPVWSRNRRAHRSRFQKGEPFVGAARRDFENVGAHDAFRNERIFLHTRFEAGARGVVGEDGATRVWLDTAYQQEDAIVEAAFDPGVVTPLRRR